MTTGFLGDAEFEAVLSAARDGEAWAFERLFHLVAQPLASYFRAEGSTDPDGLTNETLLRAFTGVGNFRGDVGGFRAWAFSIARCRLIDQRRANARRPRCEPLSGEVGRTLRLDSVGDAEAEAMDALGTGWVQDTLDRLAPDQRDVLMLRVVADLTTDQVAEALGKTPGAVKALQRRGLASIRRNFIREAVSL